MSEEQNNQDEENTNTEQDDGMKDDKDQGNLENSESEADADVNNEEAVQEEAQDDIDSLDDLTKEDILELKKNAAERDTYLDQLMRAKAEFMNYQKRMVKESASTSQFAVQSLILDFYLNLIILTGP